MTAGIFTLWQQPRSVAPGKTVRSNTSSESLVGVGIVFKHDKNKERGGGLTVVALVPGGAAVDCGKVSVGMQVIFLLRVLAASQTSQQT